MKTTSFKILRIFLGLFIATLALINIFGFFYSIYQYKTLSIESSIRMGSKFTLKNFMMLLIYSNLLASFLSSYAFNIGYGFLIRFCTYVILFAGAVGLYAVVYLKQKGVISLKNQLTYGILTRSDLAYSLFDYCGNNIPKMAETYFVEEYAKMVKNFIIMESISLGMLGIILAGIFIAKFIRIEVKTPEVPVIVDERTAGVDSVSLRNKLVYKINV